jgi:ribonuclease-3
MGSQVVEQSTLEKCQELIGYRFRQPRLLALALTHASVAPTRVQSNERLEFLGDAVLAVCVCHELYAGHEELMEGDMTKVKSTVVSRRTCAEIADDIGIVELLKTNKGMADPTGMPTSVAAAVFEAIIGALYLDGGIDAATRFIIARAGPYIDEALSAGYGRNYKSLLQQHAQRDSGSTPTYRLLDEKGPDHSRCFEIAVAINGREFPSAWGRSKKQAEQRAAREALEALGLLGK